MESEIQTSAAPTPPPIQEPFSEILVELHVEPTGNVMTAATLVAEGSPTVPTVPGTVAGTPSAVVPGAPVVEPLTQKQAMTIYLGLQKIADGDIEMPRAILLQLAETALRSFDEQKAAEEQAFAIGDKLVSWRDAAESAVDLTKGYKKLAKCSTMAEVTLELDSVKRLIDKWSEKYREALDKDES